MITAKERKCSKPAIIFRFNDLAKIRHSYNHLYKVFYHICNLCNLSAVKKLPFLCICHMAITCLLRMCNGSLEMPICSNNWRPH